ncbi:hypothetical protein EW093_06605 [Thiospirochaeta perfilievii]|uniref:Uncharacterized protein n=1 Tax=Thiospirochaeta perfilievii TaxID=252967 RepID=A0A5C1QA76_9SPIO|nr:hypothetical protein [Thiospirochaeta perfilievii]QEN04381.1 hypothetical protein EW093_06605 [Thiospirochaeta perfilievii]
MDKKIFYILLMLIPTILMAQMTTDYLGGNNFNIETSTIFSGDLNDGSTGLETAMSIGLWFEFMGYSDRGILPLKDELSVSLTLTNSALYAWRGYTLESGEYVSFTPDDVTSDQADSIWFDNISAELMYGDFWLKTTGLSPEISVSQASIFSVFDSIMANTTASDKNPMPLPLFSQGNWYVDGIMSVIGRDLLGAVNVPKNRQVPVGGLLSSGYDGEDFQIDVSAGSWTNGVDNNENAWVFGLNFNWKPTLDSTLEFSSLAAFNYENIIDEDNNLTVISKNPIAVGLNYERRVKIGEKSILKPVIGTDIFYNQEQNNLEWEVGGGLKIYQHGSNNSYYYEVLGGSGDVGLFIAANINQDNQVNSIITFNEDPNLSFIPKTGGFFQIELMNITEINNQDFLWAGVGQVEHLINDKATVYIFEKYIPGDVENKTYSKEIKTFNSKIGLRLLITDNFDIDISYERTDILNKFTDDVVDLGLISTMFRITM